MQLQSTITTVAFRKFLAADQWDHHSLQCSRGYCRSISSPKEVLGASRSLICLRQICRFSICQEGLSVKRVMVLEGSKLGPDSRVGTFTPTGSGSDRIARGDLAQRSRFLRSCPTVTDGIIHLSFTDFRDSKVIDVIFVDFLLQLVHLSLLTIYIYTSTLF